MFFFFAEVAHTLFQHILRNRKMVELLPSDEYVRRTSVFWTLVEDFVDTWFHFILWSSVRRSCSHFASAHTRESKIGWLIAIWLVLASDQCFLNLGEGFRGYLISLVSMEFCWLKALRRCFSTCLGSENPWAYRLLTRICFESVFLDFGEGFRVYLISLVFQEFCSRNKLRLCFSTDQGSENPLVNCNLAGMCLGSVFFWTWSRIYWTLDFTCVDGVLCHIFYAYCNFKSVRAVLRFSFFRPTRGRSNQPSYK